MHGNQRGAGIIPNQRSTDSKGHAFARNDSKGHAFARGAASHPRTKNRGLRTTEQPNKRTTEPMNNEQTNTENGERSAGKTRTESHEPPTF
jgi:hypothetical protein